MEQPTTNTKESWLLIAVAAVFKILAETTGEQWLRVLTAISLFLVIIYHLLGVDERWAARKTRKRLAKEELKRSKN